MSPHQRGEELEPNHAALAAAEQKNAEAEAKGLKKKLKTSGTPINK